MLSIGRRSSLSLHGNALKACSEKATENTAYQWPSRLLPSLLTDQTHRFIFSDKRITMSHFEQSDELTNQSDQCQEESFFFWLTEELRKSSLKINPSQHLRGGNLVAEYGCKIWTNNGMGIMVVQVVRDEQNRLNLHDAAIRWSIPDFLGGNQITVLSGISSRLRNMRNYREVLVPETDNQPDGMPGPFIVNLHNPQEYIIWLNNQDMPLAQTTESPASKPAKKGLRRINKSREMVVDPKDSTKMISIRRLENRNYQEEEIPDPANLDKKITRRALASRKHYRQKVIDPKNPAEEIYKGALTSREERSKKIFPDPKKEGNMISKVMINNRNYWFRKKQRSTT